MADNGAFPWFKLYPKDLLLDENVVAMTAAQFGGYVKLLCYEWLDPDCSLPVGDAALANMAGLAASWETDGPVITNCFNAVMVGVKGKRVQRLANPRLMEERKKSIEQSAIQAEKGRRSAEARRKSNRGSTPVQPRFNPGATGQQPGGNHYRSQIPDYRY